MNGMIRIYNAINPVAWKVHTVNLMVQIINGQLFGKEQKNNYLCKS